MNTLFMLMAQHGQADIPLEVVASQYLGLGKEKACIQARTQSLPFPVFRAESQKAPWMVSLVDLAKWLDERREQARQDWQAIKDAAA